MFYNDDEPFKYQFEASNMMAQYLEMIGKSTANLVFEEAQQIQ